MSLSLFRTLNSATLWTAACLVPPHQRAEWQKEWRSELWHVRELCGTHRGLSLAAEREAAAFCLGAFQDAFHLRRVLTAKPQDQPTPKQQTAKKRAASHNSTRIPNTRSASLCLLFLAALAVAACCLTLALPAARIAALPSNDRDPEHVVLITGSRSPEGTLPTIPAGQFRAWKTRDQHLFDAFAFYQPILKAVTFAPHQTAELHLARSSRNLFELLGLTADAALNPDLLPVQTAGPARNPASPTLILSDQAWQTYFHRDPHIAGRILHIGLRDVEITGVLAPHQWTLPGAIEAWLFEPGDDAPAIPSNARGFLIGHLAHASSSVHLDGVWTISVPTSFKRTTDFTCISLASRARQPFNVFLFTLALALLALPATTSLPLGHYPAMKRQLPLSRRFHRWLFLASKVLLILPTIYFASLALAHPAFTLDPDTSQYIELVTSFSATLFALRWTIKDQRKRCPVCLSKLTHPARVGQPSRNFLAWNGTELICIGGHGLLHVPEIQTSWFSTQRWLYLDSSWDVLFPTPRLAHTSTS